MADVTSRQQRAAERLNEALNLDADERLSRLSNVLYDGALDGMTFLDGEGGTTTDDCGYDSDDLAAVLLPMLMSEEPEPTQSAPTPSDTPQYGPTPTGSPFYGVVPRNWPQRRA